MKRERLTITLNSGVLNKIDRRIDGYKIRNRSHAIEAILEEKAKEPHLNKRRLFLGGGEGINFEGKIISKLLLPVGGKPLN